MIKLKQIIAINKNGELTINDGKRERTKNISHSYAWHYAELQNDTEEVITSYNEFVKRSPFYYHQESKSKKDKQVFGDRFSYFFTEWFSIKFADVDFVSYKIITNYYVQHHYTMQDLMKNLPADEMIEYLKDNGLNICPIERLFNAKRYV